MGNLLTKCVVLPASRFRRARSSSLRPVYTHYRSGLQFRRDSSEWELDRKEEWILNQLRRVVRSAAQHTRFYRERFERVGFDPRTDFTFEDFGRLPILNREDILSAGGEMLSDNVPEHQRVPDSSGGSTGVPVEIQLGPEERGWSESGMQSSFEKIGVPHSARKAFFWGHHLDPKASENLSERFRSFAMNERYLDCFRLSPDTLTRYHRELENYAPDCIVAYSSSLAHFAEHLKEQSIRPRNYPRICFVTGAEKLYPKQREIIQEVFGQRAPVHERYGGRDYGLLGIQVDPQMSCDFELDWSWALVEPETNERRSSILVTKFHADAMPMIRYRVGDVGVFPEGSRPGHPAFVLEEITGRELDRIWLNGERWIAGEQIPHMLKSFAIREFMLIQAEDYSVELQMVPKDGYREAESKEILRILSANLEDLPVRLSFVSSIERTRANKWRPVVTRVKK